MNQIHLIQLKKWILSPSMELHDTYLGEKKIQERFPQIEKKLYSFEENEATAPSGLVLQFVSRCIQSVEYRKANTYGNK